MQTQLEKVEKTGFSGFLRYIAEGNLHYKVSLQKFVGRNFRSLFEYFSPRNLPLLFQLKALLEGPNGRDADRKEAAKKQALSACAPCPELIAAFLDDFQRRLFERADEEAPARKAPAPPAPEEPPCPVLIDGEGAGETSSEPPSCPTAHPVRGKSNARAARV